VELAKLVEPGERKMKIQIAFITVILTVLIVLIG
jgi:hypothetical protein